MARVTVLMPVYNGARYLRAAMDSILAQTERDFLFLIIDDCSTDDTAEILHSYTDTRIRIVRNAVNRGVAESLNIGLSLCEGDYIVRMDADDISLPDRIRLQVAYMDAHPEVAVSGSHIRYIGSMSGERHFSTSEDALKVDALFSCPLAHPTVILRRTFFGGNGYRYDSHFSRMEDYALWCTVLREHPIGCVDAVLLSYRIHAKQVTKRESDDIALAEATELFRIRLGALGLTEAECDTTIPILLPVCRGKRDFSHEEITHVAKALHLLEVRNAETRYCSRELLKASNRAILTRLLDALPVTEAVRVAQSTELHGFAYLVKRGYRGIRTRATEYSRVRRARHPLSRQDFTVFSNNCWAGSVYRRYGLKYRTPTVGLFIPGDDFVRFCADYKKYLSAELEFLPWEESRLWRLGLLENEKPYPVARLLDIEIYFMHYASQKEAREKWHRRALRVNENCLVFKLSQRECCTDEDIRRFLALPYQNKLCFSYDEIDGAVTVPDLRDFRGDEEPLLSEVFDCDRYFGAL